MRIGTVEIPSLLSLAPMAGVTDVAFRQICSEMGAGLTCTELISSKALCYRDTKTFSLLQQFEGEHPAAVQIFGSDPVCMAEAAALAIEHTGADILDINMGCPMGKIVNNGDGAALMKDPEKAGRIVEAVVKAVHVPVTAKFRRGWDMGSLNCVEFAKTLESAGVSAVAVHGRTRSMLYTGVADWDTIRKVKEQLSVPVIANGDITGRETAHKCRKWTGADGLMIGRTVFGDPWIFAEVKAALEGQEIPERPILKDRIALAVEQFRLSEQDHGEHIACLEARKHFAWYLRGVRNASFYKKEITSLNTMEDIYRIAKEISRDLQ